VKIVEKLGRIISAAANVMACAQGMCLKLGKKSDPSIHDAEDSRPFVTNRETLNH